MKLATKRCEDCGSNFQPSDRHAAWIADSKEVACEPCIKAAQEAYFNNASRQEHGDGCNSNCWCWV